MRSRSELPKFRILWLRGGRSANLDFEHPKAELVLGGRGSGKSSLLEAKALRYPKVIDIFGSRDNEGLAWCRSPYHSANEILFLTGNSVEVNGKWDTIKIRELRSVEDFKKYRVITSVSAFYPNMDEEFKTLNSLIYKVLYRRTHWKILIYLKIREASNFLYSRIRITKHQVIAKHEFLYLLRESRHQGYPIGVDTIRWTSIDKEVRDTSDYLTIKSVGILGLPRDLRFIYRYVDPYELMDPHPSVFVIATKKGAIGVGNFDFPEFHKKEDEDLLKKFRLKPIYGEIPKESDDARNIVGDYEHGRIIDKRLEIDPETGKPFSMRKIGSDPRIGRSSQTIHTHITEHNQQVKTRGECDRCRRIKSPNASRLTE